MAQLNLQSFGLAFGKLNERQDYIIDCRELRNPHRIKQLRNLHGWDAEVISDVAKSPNWGKFIVAEIRIIQDLLDTNNDINVGLCCYGGRHRSVVVAMVLQKYFAKKGYKTKCGHRDALKAESPMENLLEKALEHVYDTQTGQLQGV